MFCVLVYGTRCIFCLVQMSGVGASSVVAARETNVIIVDAAFVKWYALQRGVGNIAALRLLQGFQMNQPVLVNIYRAYKGEVALVPEAMAPAHPDDVCQTCGVSVPNAAQARGSMYFKPRVLCKACSQLE